MRAPGSSRGATEPVGPAVESTRTAAVGRSWSPAAAKVVVLPRPTTAARARPEVLFVVDVAGWTRDRRAQHLCRSLERRFACRIVPQTELTAEHLKRAHLVVVWGWRQLHCLPHLTAELRRSRGKLLVGVGSRAELEGPLRELALRTLRTDAGHVFTLSAPTEAVLRPQLPGSRSWCLPDGVDASWFAPADEPTPRAASFGPLHVGWAGDPDGSSADARDLANVLAPAFARLDREQSGRFRLLQADRVPPRRRAEHMRSLCRGLDVFLCVGRTEGATQVAFEAAACGVPIVSTRVGSMPALLDARRGRLIERSPDALAVALQALAARPDLLASMGTRVRAEVERCWTWSARAQGYARMFDDALGRTTAADARRPAAHCQPITTRL